MGVYCLIQKHQKSRPASRTELTFYVIGAGVVDDKTLHEHESVIAEDIVRQRAVLEKQQRARGLVGAFCVVLWCVDTSVNLCKQSLSRVECIYAAVVVYKLEVVVR